MRIGACQTPEILGDVDAALRVVHDFADQADAAANNTAVVIAEGKVVGRYRKTFLVSGESLFTPGDSYPVFDCAGVRFGINICYDTQHPQAAAAVTAAGAQALLVPAQNMMRREKAFRWQDRHNEIRACRAQETGMWLASADVTGERDGTHLGLGPTGFLSPAGETVGQVPAGVPGMTTADISPRPGRTLTTRNGIGGHDSASPPLSGRVATAHCCAAAPSEPDGHAFHASGSSKPAKIG